LLELWKENCNCLYHISLKFLYYYYTVHKIKWNHLFRWPVQVRWTLELKLAWLALVMLPISMPIEWAKTLNSRKKPKPCVCAGNKDNMSSICQWSHGIYIRSFTTNSSKKQKEDMVRRHINIWILHLIF
jgi:hypothetical protein